MSGLTCSICLEELKQPMATPCGHIHCKQCLQDYIKIGEDPIQATCPKCRAPFYTVKPDLDYIPDKFHPFVMPSIRRIYLDIDAENDHSIANEVAQLQQRIDLLEQQLRRRETTLQEQKRTTNLFMQQCESHIAASRHHALKERDARLENDALKAEMKVLKVNYYSVRDQYNALMEDQGHSESMLDETRPSKRKNIFELSDASSTSMLSMPMMASVPIPKRPRLARPSFKAALKTRLDSGVATKIKRR